MVDRREWRWVAGAALAIVLASWLPYLVGWVAAPTTAHFTGLVYNPIDGQSYIAKMRQGSAGSWLFQLTYTPEPHPGAPIYLFYLLLGHLARWTGLPLLAVYHGVRTMAGLAFLCGLYRLAADLVDGTAQRRFLFALAALGAGLGWLSGPLGRQTPDLWVNEAFPFAAMLTNAHFPTALALMVWAAHWGLQVQTSPLAAAALAASAVGLGAIQPFGLAPLCGGLAGAWLMQALRRRPATSQRARGLARQAVATITAALLALPYPLYTLGAMHADPILAAWTAQNLTPSPSLLDWLLGLGLLAPLAVGGGLAAIRRGSAGDGLLLGWVGATAVGLALPLDLVRRLSLGLAVAVGLLAGLGWLRLTRRWRPPIRRLGAFALATLTALTPLFLLILGGSAALTEHPLLYLGNGEWAALAWLREHAPPDTVVLCAPETGLFVPAWAGQRVVYGHPFETIDAATRQLQVEQFWSGERDESWLEQLGVGYIIYGPRERALGPPPQGEPLFSAGDAAIYQR